jgi:hypothetical protein
MVLIISRSKEGQMLGGWMSGRESESLLSNEIERTVILIVGKRLKTLFSFMRKVKTLLILGDFVS